MSFERFLKMQMPIVLLFSGLTFVVCDWWIPGAIITGIGFILCYLFRKEFNEIVDLADNDKIKESPKE